MAVVGTLASLFPAMDLEDKRRQASKHLEPTSDCCARIIKGFQAVMSSTYINKDSCKRL